VSESVTICYLASLLFFSKFIFANAAATAGGNMVVGKGDGIPAPANAPPPVAAADDDDWLLDPTSFAAILYLHVVVLLLNAATCAM
jgi:hypothetical protein